MCDTWNDKQRLTNCSLKLKVRETHRTSIEIEQNVFPHRSFVMYGVSEASHTPIRRRILWTLPTPVHWLTIYHLLSLHLTYFISVIVTTARGISLLSWLSQSIVSGKTARALLLSFRPSFKLLPFPNSTAYFLSAFHCYQSIGTIFCPPSLHQISKLLADTMDSVNHQLTRTFYDIVFVFL